MLCHCMWSEMILCFRVSAAEVMVGLVNSMKQDCQEISNDQRKIGKSNYICDGHRLPMSLGTRN